MSKQKKLESPGRDRFVDAVLEMLDEGVGVRDLNLRTISRRLGYAHTNAYNCFSSLEDLLWWSLREALERMVGGGDPLPDNQDPLLTYIDFAIEHPEWYRLVWLVPLNGPPPLEVLAYLPVPGRMLVDRIEEYLRRNGGTKIGNNPMTAGEIEAGLASCTGTFMENWRSSQPAEYWSQSRFSDKRCWKIRTASSGSFLVHPGCGNTLRHLHTELDGE